MPTLKEMNRHVWGCGLRPHPHSCRLLCLRWPLFSSLLEVQPETSPAGSLWDKVRVSGPHGAIRSRGTALSEAL